MQIQCPHCKSRYRLGDEMVDAYGGFVRCGNCNYKFNIHDMASLASRDDTLLNTGLKPKQGKGSNEHTTSTTAAPRIEPRLERDEQEEALNIRFRPDGEEMEEEQLPDRFEAAGLTEPRLDAGETLETYDPLEHFNFQGDVDSPEDSDPFATAARDELQGLEPEPVEIEPRADAPVSEADAGEDAEEVILSTPEGPELEKETTEARGDAEADTLDEGLEPVPVEIEPRADAAVLESDAGEDAENDFLSTPEEPELKTETTEARTDTEADALHEDPERTLPQLMGPYQEALLEEGEQEEGEPLLFASLDDFDNEESSSSLTLINDEGDEEEDEPGIYRTFLTLAWRFLVFMFWVGAAIALVWLLLGQVRDTLYPAYKQHSLVQKMRTIACTYLPCLESKYDSELYEIVVSRMDETGGGNRQLHVSIFILNKAETAQPYPNILLSLKTIDGTTAGQRVIAPEEYFTSEDSLLSSGADSLQLEARTLIKPNKLGKILIKMDNPPVEAVGFEARVVE